MSKTIIIPKINGLDIPLELYRKTDDGKTEKAIITIRDLLDKYSIINQFSDMIFAQHKVDGFDPKELNEQVVGSKARKVYKGERIEVSPEIGQEIQNARVAMGYTQNKLCEMIGVSSAFANLLEKAHGSVPLDKLEEYVEAVGLDFDDILRRTK